MPADRRPTPEERDAFVAAAQRQRDAYHRVAAAELTARLVALHSERHPDGEAARTLAEEAQSRTAEEYDEARDRVRDLVRDSPITRNDVTQWLASWQFAGGYSDFARVAKVVAEARRAVDPGA